MGVKRSSYCVKDEVRKMADLILRWYYSSLSCRFVPYFCTCILYCQSAS